MERNEKIKQMEIDSRKNLVVCVFYRFNINGEIEIITENRVPNKKGEKVAKLPGGGLQNGETVYDAIKREIKEELGFDLEKFSFQLLGDVVFELSDTLNLEKHLPNKYAKSTVFICHYPSSELPDAPINDDIESFAWLTIPNFRDESRRESYLLALDLFKKKQLEIRLINHLKLIKLFLAQNLQTFIGLVNQIKYTT